MGWSLAYATPDEAPSAAPTLATFGMEA